MSIYAVLMARRKHLNSLACELLLSLHAICNDFAKLETGSMKTREGRVEQ
jgi:hypothetical protein